jgi:hypothetical protein
MSGCFEDDRTLFPLPEIDGQFLGHPTPQHCLLVKQAAAQKV